MSRGVTFQSSWKKAEKSLARLWRLLVPEPIDGYAGQPGEKIRKWIAVQESRVCDFAVGEYIEIGCVQLLPLVFAAELHGMSALCPRHHVANAIHVGRRIGNT